MTRQNKVAVSRLERAGDRNVAMPVFGQGGAVSAAIELHIPDHQSAMQTALAALAVATRCLSRELTDTRADGAAADTG